MKHVALTAAQMKAAQERGNAEMATGAAAAHFDRKQDAVVLVMRSGAIATIPRSLLPFVAGLEPRLVSDLELSPMGTTLRFPRLDADFAVQGLIRYVFGVNEANRIAGATRSRARAAASRKNGRKGGRPKKVAAQEGPQLLVEERRRAGIG